VGARAGSVAMTQRELTAGRPFVQIVGSLALLMSLPGAKLGANAGRRIVIGIRTLVARAVGG
jgi:hypothetical protein